MSPALEDLRAHVGGRLDLLPRFRRRVLTSRAHLHDPVWVDDRDFDPANHVDRLRPEQRGGADELRALAGRLLSEQLDRRRPLWRLHLVEGPRDGGFALVGRAHHALVDGLAAVEVAKAAPDAERDHDPAMPCGWAPQPEPSLSERALWSVAERLRLGRSAASLAVRTLSNPGVLADGFGLCARSDRLWARWLTPPL